MLSQSVLCRQPFKLIYLVYFFVVLCIIKIPYWTVTYLVPSWRPRPSWTLYRSVLLRVMDAGVDAITQTSTYSSVRVDPCKYAKAKLADEVGLVKVEPTPDLVLGEIRDYALKNGVTAEPIAGYWCGKTTPAFPGEKVIYELHGGAFVIGDASPTGYLGNTYLCKEMLKHNPQFTRAFQIEYRLSQGPPLPPENAFPAALIDAVAGYHYLVRVMGFDPSNILLMGESAGGGLAIMLVRYLIDYIPSLPPPAAIFLMSPGVDWGGSHWGPESSVTKNRNTDFIGPFFGGYPTNAILGSLPPSDADTNPWISPASKYLPKPSGLFTGFPRTLHLVGDAEMLLDSNRTLRDRMRKDMGKDVTYLELPDATHLCMSFAWHEPEKARAYRDVAEWLSVTM